MVTIGELSAELGVRELDVTLALVALNAKRGLAEPLTDEEVRLVRTLLVGPNDGAGGTGVREPRRPMPSAPSMTATVPTDD